MKIIVGSANQVKINAVRRACERVFPDTDCTVEGVETDSGVADQPLSDAEALTGAGNRVAGARAVWPEADAWVGIESGVQEFTGWCGEFTWVSVEHADGLTGRARSATFPLPAEVVPRLKAGENLTQVADDLFNETDIGTKQGIIGELTHGAVTRTDYTVEAVVLALIPFINTELYGKE